MSKKRKLDEAYVPPTKKAKQDSNGLENCTPNGEKVIVKFPDNSKEIYTRAAVIKIEFCRCKLERWCATNHTTDHALDAFLCDDDSDTDIEPNKEDKSPNTTPVIDFRSYQLTKRIFDLIIKLSEIGANNTQSAVQLLLSENLVIDELPRLFEACNMLTESAIFDDKLFESYFKQYPQAIALSQFQCLMGKGAFAERIGQKQMQIIENKAPSSYGIHEDLYDGCNVTRKCHFPLTGVNAKPNPTHAVTYFCNKLDYEGDREGDRDEILNLDCEHSLYSTASENNARLTARGKIETSLAQQIDTGMIMAFTHVIDYGDDQHIIDLLTQYFKFANQTVLNKDWPLEDMDQCIYDRTCFCFHAMLHVAHQLWMLYLEKNKAIMKYIEKQQSIQMQSLFDLYPTIINHRVFRRSKQLHVERRMEFKRICDGLKHTKEWNEAIDDCNDKRFPDCVVKRRLRSFNYVDTVWLLNNFALKLAHGNCIDILDLLFQICFKHVRTQTNIKAITIPKSLNDAFKKYLGVQIK